MCSRQLYVGVLQHQWKDQGPGQRLLRALEEFARWLLARLRAGLHAAQLPLHGCADVRAGVLVTATPSPSRPGPA